MTERLEQTLANQEAEIINKLNNVIDAHNRHSELLDQIAGKVLVEPKESAEKKEETASWIKRENDYWRDKRIAEQAVEAYKKRIVEKLRQQRFQSPLILPDFRVGWADATVRAIQLVEEVE